MGRSFRPLTIAILLGVGTPALGQNIVLDDPPKLLATKKPSQKEMNQREAMYKYVYGLLCDQADRDDDALKAFVEAAKLDPDAPAIYKVQVPLLVALNRMDDAVAACKKVVELDPADYYSWYMLAKMHKSVAKYTDAIADLESGLKSADVKDHPEAAQQMYFDLGSLYESTEKFGPAADAFNKAAEILEHPDRIMQKGPFPREIIQARAAETYEKISQLYRKARQFEQAAAALRKAQEHAPERSGRLSYHLAELSIEAGNHKQALAQVEDYLKTQPLGTEAYEMKIDLLRWLKQTDGIVAWLEEAARRDKWNTALQLILARELGRARQNDRAEKLYTKLAEESPSAEIYRGLFGLYRQQGAEGMQRVLMKLNRAMEKTNNDDVPAPVGNAAHARAMIGALRDDAELAKDLVGVAFRKLQQKNDLKFDTICFLAILADRHQKNEEGERFYKTCVSMLKDNPAFTNDMVLYSGLIRILAKAHKHEAIIEECQKGLQNAKNVSPLFFYRELARAQASMRRPDEALRNVERGIVEGTDEDKLAFRALRITILTMAERFADAEAECKALLKENDRPAAVMELRYRLSSVYAASKQQEKAAEQLRIILKLDPSNAVVNNDLGYLWADQGKNLEEAEAMIRKALEQDRSNRRAGPNFTADDDKDNAAYVDSLGWVLFRRGQIEQARKELERAISLPEGDDPVIYDHLGDVYHRLGMRPDANRSWQRALELYKQGVRPRDEERIRDIQRKIEQPEG
jgi:tetratricopeptide (TPR) repeat protein